MRDGDGMGRTEGETRGVIPLAFLASWRETPDSQFFRGMANRPNQEFSRRRPPPRSSTTAESPSALLLVAGGRWLKLGYRPLHKLVEQGHGKRHISMRGAVDHSLLHPRKLRSTRNPRFALSPAPAIRSKVQMSNEKSPHKPGSIVHSMCPLTDVSSFGILNDETSDT